MRSLIRTTAVSSAVAAAALLTGCAASPAPSPTATTEPTAAPTPTPSATPAVDPADPGTWLIDATGVGPVEFGAPAETEAADLTAAYTDVTDAAACSVLMFDSAGSPSIWLSPDPGGAINAILVTGETAEGSVYAGSPRTEEGIGVGSTRAELIAAYPELADTVQDDVGYEEYSLAENAGTWIHFEVEPNGLVVGIVLNAQPVAPYEYCG
jgi:hypothetical protein